MDAKDAQPFHPGFVNRHHIKRTKEVNRISKETADKRAALRRKAKEESDAGR